jgi:hypothetical protein
MTTGKRPNAISFLALLLILWIVGVIAAFYVFHKPFSSASLERLQGILIDLSTAGAILWIGGGLGWRLSGWSERNGIERSALAGALGMGILGLAMLGLVMLGWANPIAIVVLLALIGVVFFRDSIQWASAFRQGWRVHGFLGWWCLAFCIGILLLALGTALAPPVAWDALVYHLRIPQEILHTRSMGLPGDSLFHQMPWQAEMIYTAALAVTGRGETAAVLGWLVGLLALIGLVGTAGRTGMRHPVLAAVVLLAGDTLARELGWAYADWLAALFGWAAIATIAGEKMTTKKIFLAGIFAGLAIGTKYTAGTIALVLALWLMIQKTGWRIFFKNIFALGVGVVLICIPWLIKNMALCGGLPSCLPDGRMAFFSGQQMAGAIWAVWVMPFLQSVAGTEGTMMFGATIGPLLLVLVPGALFLRHEKVRPFPLGILWLCVGAFWVMTGLGGFLSNAMAQSRLYLCLLLPIALLAAHGFDGVSRLRLSTIRVGLIATAFVLFVTGLQSMSSLSSWFATGAPNYLAGALDRTSYLQNNLGWYAPASQRIGQLASGSRALFLWEPRGYLCDSFCEEDASIDRWFLAMRAGYSAEEVLQQWRRAGYTHVLIYNIGADFEKGWRVEYMTADWTALQTLRDQLTVEEYFNSAYTLYRIQP